MLACCSLLLPVYRGHGVFLSDRRLPPPHHCQPREVDDARQRHNTHNSPFPLLQPLLACSGSPRFPRSLACLQRPNERITKRGTETKNPHLNFGLVASEQKKTPPSAPPPSPPKPPTTATTPQPSPRGVPLPGAGDILLCWSLARILGIVVPSPAQSQPRSRPSRLRARSSSLLCCPDLDCCCCCEILVLLLPRQRPHCSLNTTAGHTTTGHHHPDCSQ